jgi:hypothetical protein
VIGASVAPTFVIPAKAGIQARKAAPVPLDPRFRGDDGLKDMRMQKHIGCLRIVGFFGLVAAANAETPSPPAPTTQFDGTYAFVSATKVNETYFATGTNRIGQCPDRSTPSALIIVNGQARLLKYGGTVGSQGELMMRRDPEPVGRGAGSFPGVDRTIIARTDGNGTVRARQISYLCNYDLVWQKEPQVKTSERQ